MPAYPGFIGGTAKSQSYRTAIARSINLYVELVRESNKTRAILLHTPGLTPFASSIDMPGRAINNFADRCFTVMGTKFKEVNLGGTLTDRGTVQLDGLPASMDSNGDGGSQVFIISGDEGYIFDLLTNAFTHVVSNVTIAVMVDSFFCALDINSSTLRVSNAYNGLIWDGTQIAQPSLTPGPWIGMATVNDEIWLMGPVAGEVWFNKGLTFPFGPRQGLLIKPGLAASFSLRPLNGRMTWLAQDENGFAGVVQADGYAARPISTPEIDSQISNLSRIDDAVAFTYGDGTHHFYEINFPTGDLTLVYDDSTDTWHERGTLDGPSGLFRTWAPQYHAWAFGKHLVADFRLGKIYEMGSNIFTDFNGAPIIRQRVAALPFNDNKKVIVDKFEILMDNGLARTSDLVPDPHAMLQTTRNGGKTWGSERWRSMGTQAQFTKRVAWNQLGAFRDGGVKVSFSAAHPIRLVGALLELRKGLK